MPTRLSRSSTKGSVYTRSMKMGCYFSLDGFSGIAIESISSTIVAASRRQVEQFLYSCHIRPVEVQMVISPAAGKIASRTLCDIQIARSIKSL